MTQYNMPEDAADVIKALEQRVVALEKLVRAGSTSIDNGLLTIKKDGQIIAAFGDLRQAGFTNIDKPDGTPQMGVVFYRDTGEIAFSLMDLLPGDITYQQHWGLWDRSGKIIVSDDTNSGYGIARPWLSNHDWIPTISNSWEQTTSGSFFTLLTSNSVIQHPKMRVEFNMYVDAATTGETRLLINGAQYGPTISSTGAGFANYDQVLTMPEDFLDIDVSTFELQARRTAGTGVVRVQPRLTQGRQS